MPTGGCSHIVKIYNYLALTLPELKNDIKGKIYLLVDTDGDVKYEEPELRIKDKIIEKFFSIKRLVNLKKKPGNQIFYQHHCFLVKRVNYHYL